MLSQPNTLSRYFILVTITTHPAAPTLGRQLYFILITIATHPAAPTLGAACGTLRRSQRHKTRGGLSLMRSRVTDLACRRSHPRCCRPSPRAGVSVSGFACSASCAAASAAPAHPSALVSAQGPAAPAPHGAGVSLPQPLPRALHPCTRVSMPRLLPANPENGDCPVSFHHRSVGA